VNIMHICKKYPNALGGDAVVVSNLRKQQEAAGHRVAIVTSNCEEIVSGPHIYKLGLRDTPAKLDAITPRRLVSLVILAVSIFFIIWRERPDVIHTHSVDMALAISPAARLFGVPIVHTFHIVTFYDRNQSVFRRKTELWLAKGAGLHRATAPNSYDAQKLQAAGIATTVLPNGVDLEFWQSATPVKANRTFTFAAVGRLEAQKGYEYLVRAAALLAARGETFRVVIAGEGSQKARLHMLISTLHLEHIVTLTGRKTPEATRTLLARADVAVFPSLYETTPLTLLEAWAVGLPVIVTPVGILRDAGQDFGAALVVPPKDEQSLMQAMLDCKTNATRRAAIAAQGLAEVAQYGWQRVARTAETIYGATQ